MLKHLASGPELPLPFAAALAQNARAADAFAQLSPLEQQRAADAAPESGGELQVYLSQLTAGKSAPQNLKN